MTLSCDRAFGNSTYGKGIFVSLVKILKAEDISGQLLPFLEHPIDIGIQLTLDIGKSWNPELLIFGNFERDFNDEVKGWGGAFIVQDALNRLGFTGQLNADNTIPPSILTSLEGKQFYRLSYVSGKKDDGKNRYTDWNMIASVSDGPLALVQRFQKSLQKGYPRNYRPEFLDEVPTPETKLPVAFTDDVF